jgi:glucose-1-phosphate cytidylyltransferase
MVEIGGKPILWHIMKIYSYYGINDFIICCGYKGYVIKEYFANYFLHNSDVTFSLKENKIDIHQAKVEPWKITLLDTGSNTMTGGRLKKISKYLDSTFCFTYGDGLSNINIRDLITFHRKYQKAVTLSAVKPPGRYGALTIEGNSVTNFKEKPSGDGARINGGFFVVEPKAIKYINDEKTMWEDEPLQNLSRDGQLIAFKHDGFWQSMDTLRDKNILENMWRGGNPLWKVWE